MKLPDLPESPIHLLRQWPRSISVLESVPFRSGYDGASLLTLCHWAGLSRPVRLRQSGIVYQAVVQLANLAALDRHGTNYHHSGHVAHVVMAAGLLAKLTIRSMPLVERSLAHMGSVCSRFTNR